MHEVALEVPTSSIEAYNCDLCVMDPVEDGPQVTYMTAKDWQQAQLADPIWGQDAGWDLGPVPIQADWLAQAPAAPLGMQLSQAEAGHLVGKVLLKGSQEALFQFVLPALEGYHDEIGHLDLKRMLNLMCDHFLWSQMAIQAKEHL